MNLTIVPDSKFKAPKPPHKSGKSTSVGTFPISKGMVFGFIRVIKKESPNHETGFRKSGTNTATPAMRRTTP